MSSPARPARRKDPGSEPSRARPGGDLAGRWLSKFLTSHLAAERDLSPQTIASYRDAIRLLLTWFRDVQGTPPERLRLAAPHSYSPSIRMDVCKGEVIASTEEELLS